MKRRTLIKNGVDMEKLPKKSEGDIAHKALSIAFNLTGGPLASALFEWIIKPPVAERQQKWMESVAETMERLCKTVEGLTEEKLRDNSAFITAVLHATTIAIRSHQQEKLDALRNAILNSALGTTPDVDLQQVFLNIIDSFTPSHLLVLKRYKEPGGGHDPIGPKFLQDRTKGVADFVATAVPELKGREEFFEQCFNDLVTRGLIERTHKSNQLIAIAGPFAGRVTRIGDEFLKFVTSPLQGEQK